MGSMDINQLEALFLRALAVAPERRHEFISEVSGADDQLRRKLHALVDAHEANGEFMSVPSDQAPRRATQPERSMAGVRIGPYTIVRKLAMGGMGVVYEARQEHPHRLVALKVMRQGLMSESIRRRFRYEIEILGRLQHPSIAAIYDAGIEEDPSSPFSDSPYFAMELVEGRTLLEYAEAHRLDRRERLRLISEICMAVHHAHQNGIIHRDLKPANILVTASGHPKILDFGVARATTADLQLTTIETHAGQLIGTVSYMSPEQFRGDPVAIDARSDIYSIGVMMYELLAGRQPHSLHPHSIAEAARIACEEEPPTLGTIDRTLRGDIETIAAKALEIDRDRRYSTAAELADDIRRHLSDEPIIARAPTTLYQLRKFTSRNKGLVGGVVTAFVLLIAAVGGTAFGLIEANRERAAAIDAAREAGAVRDFLNEMLSSVDPSKSGYQVTVSEVLDNAARDIESRFADQPVIRASLHKTIGQSYMNLGIYNRGRSHLRKALALYKERMGPRHPESIRLRLLLARARINLEESERLIREAVTASRSTFGSADAETLEANLLLADTLIARGNGSEAEQILKKTLEIGRDVLGDDHELVHWTSQSYGRSLQAQGKLDEAERAYEEALKLVRRNPDKDYRFTVSCVMLSATLQSLRGRHEEAVEQMRYSREVLNRVLGETHPATLSIENHFAEMLIEAGRFDKAEMIARRNVDLARTSMSLGDDHSYSNSLRVLALLLYKTGRLDEAEKPAMEARQQSPKHNFYGSASHLDCLLLIGRLRIAQNRLDKALEALQAALDLAVESPPPFVLTQPEIEGEIGRCLLKMGRLDDAEPRIKTARDAHARVLGEEDPTTVSYIRLLGEIDQQREIRSAKAVPADPP